MQHRARAVAAAALAAAGVVTAAVLVGGTDPDGPPDRTVDPTAPGAGPATTTATPDEPGRATFTPATYDGWLEEVPADVPVAHGLPGAGGDVERVDEPVTADFCGTEALPLGSEVASRRAGATGPEHADLREVRVFADDRTAHRFLRGVAQRAAECDRERHGDTAWLHEVVDAGPGEESVRVVRSYETDGMVVIGATWWEVVRVGNGVLLASTSGEYFPGETLGPGIAEYGRLLRPAVDALCAFAAEPCPSGTDGAGSRA